MTDMIARDLEDMHRNPMRALIALALTIAIILSCIGGCLWTSVRFVIGLS